MWRRANRRLRPRKMQPWSHPAGQEKVWHWLRDRFPTRALTLDASPQLDLDIDSLEWVSLTLEIEERFGVALTGDAVSRILTLRDLRPRNRGRAPGRARHRCRREAGMGSRASQRCDARPRRRSLRARMGRYAHLLPPTGCRAARLSRCDIPMLDRTEPHELPRPAGDRRGLAVAAPPQDVLGRLGRDSLHRAVHAVHQPRVSGSSSRPRSRSRGGDRDRTELCCAAATP